MKKDKIIQIFYQYVNLSSLEDSFSTTYGLGESGQLYELVDIYKKDDKGDLIFNETWGTPIRTGKMLWKKVDVELPEITEEEDNQWLNK
ncbi:MAG TPA: hypothetical protein VIR31_02280 [Nitrososphaeraceae archaeon]